MVALPEASPNGSTPAPSAAPKPTGFLKSLGPGLVTGAADDDPSGIATYSQVGAQFGYGLAWTMLFSFPLMAVIQAVSARIGCVTGYGIAHNLRRHYSPWLLRAVVLLLFVANVINLGADLGAMGAALGLLIGGPEHLYAVMFGIVCILLETFISYARYAAMLKWATLSLFAYVARGVCRARAVGRGALRYAGSALRFRRTARDGAGRRSRHDDQPLSVLLAGRTGGRGVASPSRQAAVHHAARRRVRNSRASAPTPSSAWGSRT